MPIGPRVRLPFTSRVAALPTALVLAAALAAPAMAQAPCQAPDALEILPPAEQYAYVDYTKDHPASIAMAAEIERALGGVWRVGLWNQHTNTPRRVYGSGIDVASGGFSGPEDVDRAARAFIAAHPDLFLADPNKLALHRVKNGMGKWVVIYQQVERGYKVADAYVDLTFTEEGRLFAWGSNFVSGLSVPPVPILSREAAAQIARTAVPYDPQSSLFRRPDDTLILPALDPADPEGGMTYRLVHRTDVPTKDPDGLYETYVDATTGEIVRRENLVEDAYTGSSKGDVEIPSYCAGNTPNSTLSQMNIVISGVGTAVTDVNGNFSIAGNVGNTTYTAQFDGPVVNVDCSGCGGDATVTGSISPDTPTTIYFPSTLRADERDCFYFVTKTYDYVRTIDPSWTLAKHTANVNVASTCNANWSFGVMNFFRAGGTYCPTGCANTGTIGDVMAHEYGHGIQNDLLGGQGQQGLGEGNGDITGTLMINGSTIGVGFCYTDCVNGLSCPGASCRDCENTLIYPNDVVGQEIHDAGRVICGFHWDAWQGLAAKYGAATGKEKGAQLWHYSRSLYGTTSMTQPDQVYDYFLVNDNDGNLSNGTPDYAEICTAATNHGFTCPEITTGVQISHVPLGSQSSFTTPYEVLATITTTAPPLDTDSLLVYYRLNQTGGYSALLMTATGNPNEYRAYIPAQPCGTTVDYYIFAKDEAGNSKTSPSNAPTSTYLFQVATPIYSQNFETSSDWTQDPSHTASTGAFVRIDPNPTSQQPGDDATPGSGIYAWITAQNSSDGVDDVDNGVAATRSPIFDLSGYTEAHLSMKYFHGQRDPGDDPTGDFFKIQVSNDGGTSYPVALVSYGDVTTQAIWRSLEVDLEGVIALTSQMRLRVQAADGAAAGDLVEGGIDEIYLSGCVPPPVDTIPPVVTVLAPNGGEYIIKDSSYNILWTATDNVGVTSVDILYSATSGGTYLATLASGEPNDGSFTWTASHAPTQDARIKVVAHDAASLSGEDQSDADFTIGPPPSGPPTAALLGPNGGESLDAQTTATVTWTATDDIAVTDVSLFLSLDGGATYPITIATGELNDGSYTWSVYDTSSTQARIRVVASDANFQTDADGSDADFTITLGVGTGIGETAAAPRRLSIGPNVPEPTTGTTTVRFGIPRATRGELAVYSAEGRLVKRLAGGSLPAGFWERVWDGRDDGGSRVPAGAYFLRLSTGEGVVSHRLTVVR